MGEVGAIAAPMERIEAEKPAKGLRGHGTLHGMIRAVARAQGDARHHEDMVRNHGAIGIAQVPGDQVVLRVDMAGGAGNHASPGKLRII